MKRKLTTLLLVIGVLSALAWTSTAHTTDQCTDCGVQCANEAHFYMMECLESSNWDTVKCQGVYARYVKNCKLLFCNYGLGCSL